MHDKPEVFVFQENLDTVTLNDYPLPSKTFQPIHNFSPYSQIPNTILLRFGTHKSKSNDYMFI